MAALATLMFYILVAITHSNSVTVWNKCVDVPFCNRLRNNKPDQNRYVFNSSSIALHDDYALGKLIDTKSSTELNLYVFMLVPDTFYIVILNPIANKKPLEHLKHVFVENLKPLPLKLNAKTKASVLTNGRSKLIIQDHPFKLSAVKDDKLVLVINEDGHLEIGLEEPAVAVAVDVTFPGALEAYGLGEHADRLALRNTSIGGTDPYRFFNIDHGSYRVESTEALYGAEQLLYGSSGTSTSAIYWNVASQTWVDVQKFGNKVKGLFMSESGTFAMVICTGNSFKEVSIQYTALTGTATLPQYFTLGEYEIYQIFVKHFDILTKFGTQHFKFAIFFYAS